MSAEVGCRGLAGAMFGHSFIEVSDVTREYYPASGAQKNAGPLKLEKTEHQYCVCRRCGMRVSRERKPLFSETK